MSNDKYVVFKREDWERLTAPGATCSNEALQDAMIDDAFVLRGKDACAPTALFTYANSIQNAIELIELMGEEIADDDPLREIQDTAHTRAVEWQTKHQAGSVTLPD